jgi:hypothetical protein
MLNIMNIMLVQLVLILVCGMPMTISVVCFFKYQIYFFFRSRHLDLCQISTIVLSVIQ